MYTGSARATFSLTSDGVLACSSRFLAWLMCSVLSVVQHVVKFTMRKEDGTTYFVRKSMTVLMRSSSLIWSLSARVASSEGYPVSFLCD